MSMRCRKARAKARLDTACGHWNTSSSTCTGVGIQGRDAASKSLVPSRTYDPPVTTQVLLGPTFGELLRPLPAGSWPPPYLALTFLPQLLPVALDSRTPWGEG